MLLVWLVVGLVHSGRAGDLYSSVEAHGPLARQALDIYRHSGSLHATYPAAPVHHIPSAAVDVPVTQLVSQPGYIQKLVNVAKPDIATAKLEVRRPAIQKKFYDIEHRTVVRPVGSAVVELEHPVRQKYLTPFIDSSGKSHTVAKFHGPVVYPAYSYPFYSPQYFPVQSHQYIPGLAPQYIPGQIPQYIPVQAYPPSFAPAQIPNRPLLPPQQTPVFPQQPQRPTVPARPPPQVPQPAIPSPDDIETNIEFDPSDTVVVDNPDLTKSKNTTESSDDDKETEDSFEEFAKEVNGEANNFNVDKNEDSDNIQNILDEFEKRQNLRTLLRQNDFQPNDLIKLNQFTQQSTDSQSQNQHPAPSPTSLANEPSQPQTGDFHILEHSEPNFNFKVITNTDETNTNKQVQDKLHDGGLLQHSEPDFSFKIVPVPDNNEKEIVDDHKEFQLEHDLEEIHKILEYSEPDFSLKIGVNSEHKQTTSSTTQPEIDVPISSTTANINKDSPQKSSFDSETVSARTNTHESHSFRRLSAEELQENQQKLIKLLTGQGLISEVALSRSGIKFDPVGDLGVVRGKVVSVTAAPRNSQAEERVSTRRVVVSRPVHTVEEVDVHHPVTQVQRVAIHEPTLVQTAHTHFARVPVLSTAVPYH